MEDIHKSHTKSFEETAFDQKKKKKMYFVFVDFNNNYSYKVFFFFNAFVLNNLNAPKDVSETFSRLSTNEHFSRYTPRRHVCRIPILVHL